MMMLMMRIEKSTYLQSSGMMLLAGVVVDVVVALGLAAVAPLLLRLAARTQSGDQISGNSRSSNRSGRTAIHRDLVIVKNSSTLWTVLCLS